MIIKWYIENGITVVVLVIEWFVIGVKYRYFLNNVYVGIVQNGIGGKFVPNMRNVYKLIFEIPVIHISVSNNSSAEVLGYPVLFVTLSQLLDIEGRGRARRA